MIFVTIVESEYFQTLIGGETMLNNFISIKKQMLLQTANSYFPLGEFFQSDFFWGWGQNNIIISLLVLKPETF